MSSSSESYSSDDETRKSQRVLRYKGKNTTMIESPKSDPSSDIDLSEDSDLDPTFTNENKSKRRKKLLNTSRKKGRTTTSDSESRSSSSSVNKDGKINNKGASNQENNANNQTSQETSVVAKQENITKQEKNTTSQQKNQNKDTSSQEKNVSRTHSYSPHEFFVRIDDLKKTGEDIPIWKLRGSTLLEEMQPEVINGETYYVHKGIYRGYSKSTKPLYQRIYPDLLFMDKRKVVRWNREEVSVDESPVVVEGLKGCHEENFGVVIQALISEALLPTFVSKVCGEKKDPYFIENIGKFDDLMKEKLESFVKAMPWGESTLLKVLNVYPSLSVIDPKEQYNTCSACKHVKVSCKVVVPYGKLIVSLELVKSASEDLSFEDNKCWNICENCLSFVNLYMKAVHYKQLLFKECVKKVEETRKGSPQMEKHDIIVECTSDQTWTQKLFHDLKKDLWRIDEAAKVQK